MADLTTAAGALAAVNDRTTSEEDLATIASDYPDLRYLVAGHPNAYPELLDWLWLYGGDEARQVINRRTDVESESERKPFDSAAAPTTTARAGDSRTGRTRQPPPVEEDDEPPRGHGGLFAGVALVVIALILALVFFGVPGTGFKGVLDRFSTPPTSTPTHPANTGIAPTTAAPTTAGPTAETSTTSAPPPTGTSSTPPSNYAAYSNPRFGFRVDYPTTLTADTPPANGDGQSWSATQGNVKFVATGLNNTAGDAAQQVASDLAALKPAGAKVVYQDSGTTTGYSWGAVSGTSAGGSRSFYVYEAMGAGSGTRLSWTWDTSATSVQDWITHCYKSLQSGDLSKAH